MQELMEEYGSVGSEMRTEDMATALYYASFNSKLRIADI